MLQELEARFGKCDPPDLEKAYDHFKRPPGQQYRFSLVRYVGMTFFWCLVLLLPVWIVAGLAVIVDSYAGLSVCFLAIAGFSAWAERISFEADRQALARWETEMKVLLGIIKQG